MALPIVTADEQLLDLEIDLLLRAILERYGYDFRNYAATSLRRRIEYIASLESVQTISHLQSRILRDPACMRRFINALSVHTTAMFRDPEFFHALRTMVLPLLRTYPFIRIWHAGCASGEEVYSMAILLEEAGLYDRARLYATDLSDTLLAHAARGVCPIAGMRENTQNYVRSGGKRDFSRYYTAERHTALLRPELRRNMIFSQHNLVSDAAFNEFQLVLCRNVMIYFNPTLRSRVGLLLHDSMVRNGILALGMRETLEFTPLAERFSVFDARLRLYRRLA